MDEILESVQRRGDVALRAYTKKFDGHSPVSLEVTAQEWRQALQKVSQRDWQVLRLAAKRIASFHQRQKKIAAPRSWQFNDQGLVLGQRVTPLDRVGIYVPGGRATYPSTVLMNALPARVAGVSEIIMVTPCLQGRIDPHTLAAAKIAGVDRVFKIGGAQAVAALAYGTKSVPRVDKIVGPGNIFVATAKSIVAARGLVGIDGFAGPTEVVIIADETARPDWIAADLISQAEHDPNASAILLSPVAPLITAVKKELAQQLKQLDRKEIATAALRKQGKFIQVANLREACERSNQIAPEHLELLVNRPKSLLPWIRHAGAIFLGHHSPVALGDYLAGPNHVLPTAGTARFASPLGVADFLKFSSIIAATSRGLSQLAAPIQTLAQLEGLTGHGKSVKLRAS